MPRLRLVIANKNYSSWSMRPWVLLTQAGIAFEEVQLKFNDDVSVRGIEGLSPTGKVPCCGSITNPYGTPSPLWMPWRK